MKNWYCLLLPVAAMAMFSMTGCGGESSSPVGTSAAGAAEVDATVTICGGCGQEKGSDSCCAEGAEKCSECSLAKGSPGCCKLTSGEDSELCRKCGQVAGGDGCCKDGAEKCDDCGLTKGSPGCCKIEPLADKG